VNAITDPPGNRPTSWTNNDAILEESSSDNGGDWGEEFSMARFVTGPVTIGVQHGVSNRVEDARWVLSMWASYP
jgi:hypothetical protein